MRIMTKIAPAFLTLLLLCSCSGNNKPLVVFYAPCYSPVVDILADETEETLGIKLRGETAGSQVCCRKVTELGRECDLLMLADTNLFKKITQNHVTWRIDFAHDSIVLGIGTRAKRTDEAEKDWAAVLLDEKIRLGRVDENLGPIGYRTLLSWKLMERLGNDGLYKKLLTRTGKVVDHVAQLATLLKAGDIDYGFLYRTTCLKYDIRYIKLDTQIDLGTPGQDYSAAEVTFKKLKSGAEETVSVKGSLITYGLSIPSNAPDAQTAVGFIKYMLGRKKEIFNEKGFSFFTPKFYGSREDYEQFKDIAEYAGDF